MTEAEQQAANTAAAEAKVAADKAALVASEAKTFTQAELDTIVVDRLKREKNKFAKELGIEDDFTKEGYEAFKKYQDSQKTELELAQASIKAFEADKLKFATTKSELETKLAGAKLGIAEDKMSDVMVLAQSQEGDNIEAKIQKVLEKYPIFKGATKDVDNLGTGKGNKTESTTQSDEWMRKKGYIK